jgi:alpha-beta hydrolase superfamily lysophospholipase
MTRSTVDRVVKSGPTFFGPPDRRLFGWLHLPSESVERADVGVVLCNPFGYEAMCTHRSLRHFAEAFARAGYPALRFDYDGTGDSAGSDRDPDRVRAWLDSVHEAVETLKAARGVRSVCLLGLRLGAAIAAIAAAERTDCAGLIALAPVASPALYLRELQASQAWSRLGKSPDGVRGIDQGDLEASGFLMTASTTAALGRLDLLKQSKAPASHVLVLERADRPPGAWADRLKALDVDVEVRSVPGFVEMSWDSHRAVVPDHMIAASLDWLAKKSGGLVTAVGEQAPSSAPARRTAGTSNESPLEEDVLETPVFVDAKRTLFGIVTHPKATSRNGRAIILVNTGTQHRVGPNRQWVTLARHWARMGVVVLRLDLSGLGDSSPRPGANENTVYTDGGPIDVADAVAYLQRDWGARRFDFVGLCSGAYYCFRALVRGVGADSAVLVNPQILVPDPPAGDPSKTAREAKRLRQSALKAESWKKLLRGEVKLRASGRVLIRRLVDWGAIRARRVAQRLGISLSEGLPAELVAVARRKVVLRFVFSDGEKGEELLMFLGGSTIEKHRKRGLLSISHVRGADHTFSAAWMQRALAERLDGLLGLGDHVRAHRSRALERDPSRAPVRSRGSG